MQDITKSSEPIVTAVDPTQQISPENQTALPGAEELQEVFEAATEGLSEEEISAFLFGDDADVLETAADSSPASGGGSAYRDDMGGLIELLDDRTAVPETALMVRLQSGKQRFNRKEPRALFLSRKLQLLLQRQQRSRFRFPIPT